VTCAKILINCIAHNAQREFFYFQGVIVLPFETVIAFVCTSTTTKSPASWCCPVPAPGGDFEMPSELLLLKKHSFLLDFMERRLLAALMLQCFNDEMPLNKKVQSSAVQSELTRVNLTTTAANNGMKLIAPSTIRHRNRKNKSRNCSSKDKTLSPYSLRNNFLIQHSFLHCRYTIVMHPVGMHCDNFGTDVETKEKSHCLENKRCFTNSSITHALGRGGDGSANFVWALLDW
jgi:hypothetical protein